MTNERAKSELEQLYMSLSEEKKKALDVAFKAMEQADGEYISRQTVIDIIEDVCPIYGNDYRYILREKVNELPSVAIPSAERGHWIYIGNKDVSQSIKIVKCDKCHKRSYGSTKFCPNCGIKMDCTTLD